MQCANTYYLNKYQAGEEKYILAYEKAEAEVDARLAKEPEAFLEAVEDLWEVLASGVPAPTGTLFKDTPREAAAKGLAALQAVLTAWLKYQPQTDHERAIGALLFEAMRHWRGEQIQLTMESNDEATQEPSAVR